MKMVRFRVMIACAGVVLAAAGCGSSGAHSSSSSQSNASHSTASHSTASHSAGATLASQPPGRILAAAAAALRAAHGYTMSGAVTQSGHTLHITLKTTSATSLDLSYSIGPAAAQLIGLPSGSYIRANTAFWRSQAGAKAAKLAGHWIQVPYANAKAVTSSLGSLAPATLSRCLLEDHGALTKAGAATVGGRSAIVVKDAGNTPGSSAGEFAIAATGTPYPLRYVATGAERAGGHIDVCNNGKASNARGSITFSDFDHVAAIRAPKKAIQAASGPAT